MGHSPNQSGQLLVGALFFFGPFALFWIGNTHAAQSEFRYANCLSDFCIVQSEVLNLQQQTECKVTRVQPIEISFGIDRLSGNQTVVRPSGGNLSHPTRPCSLGASFKNSIFFNSDESINCGVYGFSFAEIRNIPSPFDCTLFSDKSDELGMRKLISYRYIGLLVPLHGVELTAHYDQLLSREASQDAGGRGCEKREFLGRGFPPFWSAPIPSLFSFHFLKNLCLYAGFASCILSLVLVSIHHQYELAPPKFLLGLD
jgi:hypothetical protein